MSRGLDDPRDDRATGREPAARVSEGTERDARPSVPIERLGLPRGDRREPVSHGDKTYELRESEVRLLATVGTFRNVAAHDLDGTRGGRDVWHGDLQRLVEQGLVERTTATVNRQPTAIVTLTREGRDLLDAHQRADGERARQTYYAGVVKTRELGHDAQLYRLFQAEAGKIESAGGRVERVVIDHELKREYQRFLNRAEREEGSEGQDLQTFADAWGLPVIDGHLELPDLRIEYETEDGRQAYRDAELLTEHYSRGQLAGKARSGFSLYRAAGSRGLRGGSSRGGGTPIDPHNLEWLG
jgi:hypothetical protein